MKYSDSIQLIRKFNRDYTNSIGLMQKNILDSNLSLTESRVLLEISFATRCNAKELLKILNIDPGYMSRIIRKLVQMGLVSKTKSDKDQRAYLLELTDEGTKILADLNEKSDAQIEVMIANLSLEELSTLEDSIGNLYKLLLKKSPKQSANMITIRNTLNPGDTGTLIKMHGQIYAKECNYNETFEGYVCQTFYDFMLNEHHALDKIWIAETDTKIIGSIAIVARSEKKAQLRWFIVDPEYRKHGLGKKLLTAAMDYCEKSPFESVFLETTKEQLKAISMYQKAGFEIVREYPIDDWGHPITGLTMEITY